MAKKSHTFAGVKTIAKQKAIPERSAILDGFGEVHFHDTWQIADETDKTAAEVMQDMMRLPPWATLLFKLRNAAVGVFGLKTGRADAAFPIISQTETEVVSGLGDSHLDFRVSILKDSAAGTVSLTTVVHFNNLWGRLYFLPVEPFHKMIVRSLLRRYRQHII